MTADAVRSLQASALLPGGSVLVLVGDLDPTDAVARVEKALAGWSGGQAAPLPALPELRARDLLLVDRPGAVQSQLRLSAPAVGRTDPRYPALQLANLALGGYFSSRLVENLREDKGYTYHASSSLELDPHGAVLAVETDVASEVTAPALLEARYELGRLAVVPPTDDEVESARRYLVGSLLISMTTQAGYASTVAALAAHGLSSAWVREHPARLEAVTTDEVAAAAAEFFAPTRFTGVVVADAARTGPGLQRPRRSGDSVTSGTAGPDLRAAFHLDEDPSLSRSTVDRREQLRVDPAHSRALWPDARVVLVDPHGRTPVERGEDGTRDAADGAGQHPRRRDARRRGAARRGGRDGVLGRPRARPGRGARATTRARGS